MRFIAIAVIAVFAIVQDIINTFFILFVDIKLISSLYEKYIYTWFEWMIPYYLYCLAPQRRPYKVSEVFFWIRNIIY